MHKIRALLVYLLSNTIGELLVITRPKRTKELMQEGITVVMENDGVSIWERLMRRSILRRVEKRNIPDELSELHKSYWKNKGNDFFKTNNRRLEEVHLPFCNFIFDLLEEELSKKDETYNSLVEIGTGNGRVLEYLSFRFNEIERFIGIDLSEEQTNINQKFYKENSKLKFTASDAFEWVNEYGQGNTIFLTFMGVLEYFTEQKLQDFLNKINTLGKIFFIAIEPNSINHDLVKNSNSMVYGAERSFSHNYAVLFKNAGFELWHISKKHLDSNSEYIRFIGARNR